MDNERFCTSGAWGGREALQGLGVHPPSLQACWTPMKASVDTLQRPLAGRSNALQPKVEIDDALEASLVDCFPHCT